MVVRRFKHKTDDWALLSKYSVICNSYFNYYLFEDVDYNNPEMDRILEYDYELEVSDKGKDFIDECGIWNPWHCSPINLIVSRYYTSMVSIRCAPDYSTAVKFHNSIYIDPSSFSMIIYNPSLTLEENIDHYTSF